MTIKAHIFFCYIILIFVLLTNEKQNLKQIMLLLLYNGKSISASSDFVLRRMILKSRSQRKQQENHWCYQMNSLICQICLIFCSLFLGTIGCGAVPSKYEILKFLNSILYSFHSNNNSKFVSQHRASVKNRRNHN